MFAVGFAQTGLSRLTISLVSLVERWVIHKAKEGAVEANKYFAQLPTYTLKHVATALAHNSRATFSLSPIRSAELYAGLIGELNRRGLFGSSIRLIDSQLCNASSFLRVVDPSQQVVSDLLSQCAAANLANFFLQGKGDGRDLLVDAGEITQRTLLARLGRICALITHSDAPVVNAYQEILGNLRVRGWAEYDLSE
jgi:hypothetical protein